MDGWAGGSPPRAMDWRVVPPALLGVYFFTAFMDSLPLTAMALFLNRQLGLAGAPERLSQFYALQMLPFLFKWAYGGLSDLLPIYGQRRRPYVVAGALLGSLNCLVLGLGVRSYTQLCVVGVVKSLCASLAETGADGLLVELNVGDPLKAAQLQSAAMSVRTTSTLAAGLLGMWALTAMSARALIAASGVFGLLAAGFGLYIPDSLKEVRAATTTAGSGGRGAHAWWQPWRRMMTAVTGSVLVPVALFLFVYNATPEALPYESYVMTAFPQLTTWQLGLRSFLTSLGSLVGVLLYWRLFTQVDVRVALATTTAAACAAGATRALLSSPSVLKSLSPNTVTLALLGDTLGVAVAERVAFMPLLTLVAAHAPAGYEATWYCGLTSVLDWGTEVGQATTAALTRALQVGAPPARSWRHLTAFVLIASATKLCTLPLLLLVRKADPTGIGVGLVRRRGGGSRSSSGSDKSMADVTQLDLEEALLLDDEQAPSVANNNTAAAMDADVLAVLRGARGVDW